MHFSSQKGEPMKTVRMDIRKEVGCKHDWPYSWVRIMDNGSMDRHGTQRFETESEAAAAAVTVGNEFGVTEYGPLLTDAIGRCKTRGYELALFGLSRWRCRNHLERAGYDERIAEAKTEVTIHNGHDTTEPYGPADESPEVAKMHEVMPGMFAR